MYNVQNHVCMLQHNHFKDFKVFVISDLYFTNQYYLPVQNNSDGNIAEHLKSLILKYTQHTTNYITHTLYTKYLHPNTLRLSWIVLFNSDVIIPKSLIGEWVDIDDLDKYNLSEDDIFLIEDAIDGVSRKNYT